jgi:hypothetical protein
MRTLVPDRPSRRTAVTGLLAPLLLLALAACGQAGDDPGIATAGGATPSASASNASQQDQGDPEKFEECMEKYGIQVQTEIEGDGKTAVRVGGGPGSAPVDEGKMQEAQKACQQYSPMGGPGGGQPMSQEDQKKFLAFAACMREHGIPMEDPDFEGGGVRMKIGGDKGAPQIGDDTVEAAQKACESNLPQDKRAGGGARGPGGGTRAGGGE